MILASKAFFVFLPLVLCVYHLLPRRGPKYTFLLIASWVFYGWMAPKYLWVLLALTVIDYVAGLKIAAAADPRAKRRWVALSVTANLGLLVLFKVLTSFEYEYPIARSFLTLAANGPVWQVLLPLGISFHTFQGISYTVDVYRGKIEPVRNFRDYALFVAFFPQLAAGPIVRAVEFLPQMLTPPRVTAEQIFDGLWLIAFGLFKKLLIADHLDQLFVTPVFAEPTAFDAATHRWATLAWAVQIYCDFSGYTDIAIGTGKLFGFELPPNFRLPYLATSIADFWRRWHVSLSFWLRDYLYFPLGGSRGSEVRTYANLMLVFVLCGVWHGAEWKWLAYGAFMGVLMALHRIWDRTLTGTPWADAARASRGWAAFAWSATMVQILLGLILIRMTDWAGGLLMLRSLCGIPYEPATESTAFVPWVAGAPLAVPVLIAAGVADHGFELAKRCGVAVSLPEPARAVGVAAAAAATAIFAPGVGKTFIYIQF